MTKKKKSRKGRNVSESDNQNLEGQCPHVKENIKFSNLNNVIPHADLSQCQECEKTISEPITSSKKSTNDEEGNTDTETDDNVAVCVCLRCGNIGCSRQSVHQHAVQHYNQKKSHSLAVNLSNGIVWCYECDDEVDAEINSTLERCLNLLKKAPGTKNTKLEKCEKSAEKKMELNMYSYQTSVIKGLTNLGNTCFFNSVMQNLCQSQLLQVAIKLAKPSNFGYCVVPLSSGNKEDLEPLLVTIIDTPGPLTSALGKFLQDMTSGSNKHIVNPNYLFTEVCKKAARFKGFRQQDSQELLRYLLDSIRTEEIKGVKRAILRHFGVKNAANEKGIAPDEIDEKIQDKIKVYGRNAKAPVIDSLFGGQLISSVECRSCHKVSTIMESFFDLSLSLATIENTKQDSSIPMNKTKKVATSFPSKKISKVVEKGPEVTQKPAQLSKHQMKKKAKAAKKEKKKGRRRHNSSGSNISKKRSETTDENDVTDDETKDDIIEGSDVVDDDDVVENGDVSETDEVMSKDKCNDTFDCSEKSFITVKENALMNVQKIDGKTKESSLDNDVRRTSQDDVVSTSHENDVVISHDVTYTSQNDATDTSHDDVTNMPQDDITEAQDDVKDTSQTDVIKTSECGEDVKTTAPDGDKDLESNLSPIDELSVSLHQISISEDVGSKGNNILINECDERAVEEIINEIVEKVSEEKQTKESLKKKDIIENEPNENEICMENLIESEKTCLKEQDLATQNFCNGGKFVEDEMGDLSWQDTDTIASKAKQESYDGMNSTRTENHFENTLTRLIDQESLDIQKVHDYASEIVSNSLKYAIHSSSSGAALELVQESLICNDTTTKCRKSKSIACEKKERDLKMVGNNVEELSANDNVHSFARNIVDDVFKQAIELASLEAENDPEELASDDAKVEGSENVDRYKILEENNNNSMVEKSEISLNCSCKSMPCNTTCKSLEFGNDIRKCSPGVENNQTLIPNDFSLSKDRNNSEEVLSEKETDNKEAASLETEDNDEKGSNVSEILCGNHSLGNMENIKSNVMSVESCLKKFCSPEILDGNNKFMCEQCNQNGDEIGENVNSEASEGNVGELMKIMCLYQDDEAKKTKREPVYTEAVKQLLINQAPPVLTLHLKRFQQVGFSLKKLAKHVQFPLILDLAPFCHKTGKFAIDAKGQVLYALTGLVEHTGSLHSGHYTAYCKVPTDRSSVFQAKFESLTQMLDVMDQMWSQGGKRDMYVHEELCRSRWFHVSDSHVSEVGLERVLKAQAYLLFYQRMVLTHNGQNE